jgi:hypothetical protein|nr:MAG TPA: tail completion protein [Caudoviricetes sp.]
MRSQTEIESILRRMNIPFRYFLFSEKEVVEPPFLVWYLPESNNFFADGIVYEKITRLNLELYTDQKEFELEERLESLLEAEGIAWNKTEAFLDEEQLYEVLYEMEV